MSPMPILKLAELLADPAKVSLVPTEAIPDMRGELAKLDTLLLARLLTASNGTAETWLKRDRLLGVADAAAKLGATRDWVYRNADHLPFTVRLGKKQLRFSEAGIERYIRHRVGH